MAEFKPVNQYAPPLLDCSLRCFVSAVMTEFRPVNQYALLEITMARVIATAMAKSHVRESGIPLINEFSLLNLY
jgi:hypothetical protein